MIKKHYMDEFWSIPIYFFIMISLLIRSIPIHKYYKPIQTAMLLQQTMFTVAFFKQSWRNR